MRHCFVGSFVALTIVLVFAPAVQAQRPEKPDVSGIWRMLAPGQTRARAATVGAGASHPTLGNDRPALTAWGQMKWSQTRAAGRNAKLAYVYLPDQKDWNDPLFLCDPAGYPRTGGGNSVYRFVQVAGEVVEF